MRAADFRPRGRRVRAQAPRRAATGTTRRRQELPPAGPRAKGELVNRSAATRSPGVRMSFLQATPHRELEINRLPQGDFARHFDRLPACCRLVSLFEFIRPHRAQHSAQQCTRGDFRSREITTLCRMTRCPRSPQIEDHTSRSFAGQIPELTAERAGGTCSQKRWVSVRLGNLFTEPHRRTDQAPCEFHRKCLVLRPGKNFGVP